MRVALIGPSFFGYLERIAMGFERRGIPATVHDERPSNRVAAKLALRMAGSVTGGRVLRAYHRQLAQRIREEGASHVVLISPALITPGFVAALGRDGITSFLYAWDSISNRRHLARLLPLVDAVASFDPVDCDRLDLPHVPLFGPPRPPGDTPDPDPPGPARDIDFLFCATMHSARPRWLHRISAAAKRNGWTLEVMAFYHSRSLWLIRNFGAPDLWPQLGRIRTRMFSAEEIAAATSRARGVIDIPHPRQHGLTMRVFEALAGGATVLTTDRSGARGLPEELRARILALGDGRDRTETARRMGRALDHPPPPLSTAARHFLSLDRFVEQILGVIHGVSAEGRRRRGGSAEGR